MTSLARLPSMLARAAGLRDHPWRDELPPDGVAVAQFEPPGPAEDPRWQAAFAEWGVEPEAAGELVGRPLIAATDGRRKLQLRGEREQLFDLERDPLELEPRPVGAEDEPAIGELRRALEHPAAGARPTGTVAAAPAEPAEIDDAEREKLEQRMKLLGYM